VAKDLSPQHYRDLAEFRRQIRGFLFFSEAAAKEQGLEPQQHQLLLAVHALPEDTRPTIRELAARMFIQPHSALELVKRLEQNGFVLRSEGPEDRREVWVRLTVSGRTALRKLALAHREELERSGPELAKALNAVLLAAKESHT
jgi:DNA-binding MarR family transcriptional regulator